MSLQNKFLSKELSDKFWKEGLTLATAESCTAGNIAAMITAIPGSSHFYKGGIIAYADEVKVNILGVNPEILEKHGAVSEEVVIEMAKGAMKSMKSDCGVATSGLFETFCFSTYFLPSGSISFKISLENFSLILLSLAIIGPVCV